MTAEIALLNRRALAFAADSAATISDGKIDKIYNSAEKIFEISWRSPIGLMLYNSLDFCGVPLDVLARSFRAANDCVFPTCQAACNAFTDYLCKFKRTREDEKEYLSAMLSPELVEIRRESAKRQQENLVQVIEGKDGRKVTPDFIFNNPVNSVVEIFNEHSAAHSQDPLTGYLTDITIDEFRAEFGETVENSIKRARMPNHANPDVLAAAMSWALATVRRNVFSDMLTGLVFGGFGENDIFPSLYAVEVDGIFFDQLKLKVERVIDIDRRGERAAIVPFAQSEMVERFLYGIDDEREADILTYIERSFSRALSKAAKDSGADLSKMAIDGSTYADSVGNLLNRLKERSRRETLDMVDFMPKQELSYTAEAFVTLTSMKRKVSAQQETVGGPIDVAVITKNEGFVWIKRKHYFDTELNPGYGVRARRQREGGEQHDGAKSKDRANRGKEAKPTPEKRGK